MRWLALVGLLLIAFLQYRLWVGPGSWPHVRELRREIVQQKFDNERLQQRNHVLEKEVLALKNGTDAIEERARRQLGFIQSGEKLYLIPEKK